MIFSIKAFYQIGKWEQTGISYKLMQSKGSLDKENGSDAPGFRSVNFPLLPDRAFVACKMFCMISITYFFDQQFKKRLLFITADRKILYALIHPAKMKI